MVRGSPASRPPLPPHAFVGAVVGGLEQLLSPTGVWLPLFKHRFACADVYLVGEQRDLLLIGHRRPAAVRYLLEASGLFWRDARPHPLAHPLPAFDQQIHTFIVSEAVPLLLDQASKSGRVGRLASRRRSDSIDHSGEWNSHSTRSSSFQSDHPLGFAMRRSRADSSRAVTSEGRGVGERRAC